LRLFLDTANLEEIREAVELGVISGVTTNPSLVAKENGDFAGMIKEISTLIDGPVSAEVLSLSAPEMIREARDLAILHSNVVVKIPITAEGLKAVKVLSAEGIKTNVTLVFSAPQALLAALAGAAYVSPFIGRLDDAGHDGVEVVREMVSIFAQHGLTTEIIAASIRHPRHVVEAALAGADIATVPIKVLRQMITHPLTDLGIQRFLADWSQK